MVHSNMEYLQTLLKESLQVHDTLQVSFLQIYNRLLLPQNSFTCILLSRRK